MFAIIVFVPLVHHLVKWLRADEKFRAACGHYIFSCHSQNDVLPDSKAEKFDTLTHRVSGNQWPVHGLGSYEDLLLILHLDIVGQHCYDIQDVTKACREAFDHRKMTGLIVFVGSRPETK